MPPPIPLSRPDTRQVFSFETAAREILHELQAALADLVAKLPGEVGRAVELQRSLGLDKKLGWQLFKFVKADDPLFEVMHVPGEPSIRRIISAAARRRVPRTVTERVTTTFERFERFVDEHGGDRSEIISLASGLSPSKSGETGQHELRVRKSAFKSLSHIWGIKADTTVQSLVYHASESSPTARDVFVVTGHVGLQRLRDGVPLTLGMGVEDITQELRAVGATSPNDRSMTPMQFQARSILNAQILEEASSRPLPTLLSRQEANGRMNTDVLFPASGRSGAVTLYTVRYATDSDPEGSKTYWLGILVGIPSVRMVSEILIPQGWSDPATPRAAIYGRRSAVEMVGDRRKEDLLPQRESVDYLGVFDSSPPLPGVPQHARAVRQALDQVGWLGTRYDVYRSVVDFPVLHTMLWIAVDGTNR